MPTISIVFRGLLVLNQHEVEGSPSMEIGILEAHEHVPRIMTFRNGVREETQLLDMGNPAKLWRLVVDNPVGAGISLRQTGSFNRLAGTGREDDFRWIIDLENAEFPYGDIDENFQLKRNALKHVIQIPAGEFYTRLKSPELARSENEGVPVDFGAIAGVIGCDIQVRSGGAKLIWADGEPPIFEFSSDPKVMYEIANAPADIETEPVDHFHHYYDIFKNEPPKKYGFERKVVGEAGPPGPNPALCGKIFLGEFGESLASEDGEGAGEGGEGAVLEGETGTSAAAAHGGTSETHAQEYYKKAE